jgi:anti-sigma B factor antagonist
MRIDIQDQGPVTVLKVAGSLDLGTAGSLAQAISGQIRDGKVFLVADLSEVEYTSSAGLGALVAALKETRRQGGDFRLAAPRPNVHRILDLCGLTSILKHYDATEDAVASFAA